MLRLVLDAGGKPLVGDDPETGSSAFVDTGTKAVCDALGVALVNLRDGRYVAVQSPGGSGSQYVAEAILSSDVLLSLPKIKTHSQTTITGCVKNIFGCIPNGIRKVCHRSLTDPAAFCENLVNIVECVPPDLTILDGVVGMEGHGPASGTPRNFGFVMAGHDPVAVDAAATAALGLHPFDILTTRSAHRRGIGVGDLERIEFPGARVGDVTTKGVALPARGLAVRAMLSRLPGFAGRILYNNTVTKPRIDPAACENCGECITACPAGVIEAGERFPRIDRKRCVHCLCCHEFCRHHAIAAVRPLADRALTTGWGAFRRIAGMLRPERTGTGGGCGKGGGKPESG